MICNYLTPIFFDLLIKVLIQQLRLHVILFVNQDGTIPSGGALKDLLYKVAEQHYSNNKKVPVATDSDISSSSVTYPSVTSPLIARQLGASPLSGSSVVAPIEKIVCLEFLAFMLLSLPAKQNFLEEFRLTRTNGPLTKTVSDKKKDAADTSRKKQREDAKLYQGYIPAADYMQMTLQKDELKVAVFQAQLASRHERTKELQMTIDLFPEKSLTIWSSWKFISALQRLYCKLSRQVSVLPHIALLLDQIKMTTASDLDRMKKRISMMLQPIATNVSHQSRSSNNFCTILY